MDTWYAKVVLLTICLQSSYQYAPFSNQLTSLEIFHSATALLAVKLYVGPLLGAQPVTWDKVWWPLKLD
jgi:hypothetical protein